MVFASVRFAIPGRSALPGFAVAVLVPVMLFLLIAAFPGVVSEGARAVLFVSGVIAVATFTVTPAALLCALVSFVGYRMTQPGPAVDAPWQGGDTFLLATFVALAAIVARRASRTRKEVEAIRLGRRNEAARRELTELLSAQASEAHLCRAALNFLEDTLGMKAALWVGGRGYAREGRAPNVAGATPGADGIAVGEAGWRWLRFRDHGLEGAVGLCPPAGRTLEPSTIGLVRSLSADIVHVILRTRLAKDLQKERAANESERLCTALLASVAHDLRTPLATIMASSETLRAYADTLAPGDRQALLENIESEGRRLDHYIQNLVDVTQIGQGQMDLELDCVGAEEIVASAIVRLKRYHRDASVVVDSDPELPALRVHAPLLEQALFNLLHNAAKFSPPGRPIRVALSRAGSGDLWFDVIDEGPGIPSAERERVFDMFYSADRGGKNRSGTGLGLAISQSIVRAHGGEVRADHPRSGGGTMMRIQLPATVAVGEPA